MGAGKTRRAEFFKENPRCCFCGGRELATEEDHVPARAIFDERKWPEGYNFPACERCNRITRRDENVFAFLSRIHSSNDDNQTPAQKKELHRYMAAMRHTYPDAYRAMHPTANEVRRFLRERGIQRPIGISVKDLPMIKIGQPEFIVPARNFGIKLFCALHYKHAGSIVPPNWEIAIRLMTNVQTEVLSEELFKVLAGRPTLVRSKNELDDQFHYIFSVATEKSTSAFACKFRESFVLIGIVSEDPLPESFDENPDMGAFKGSPFRH